MWIYDLRIDVPIITAATGPEARNDEVGLTSDIRIVRFRCPPGQIGVRESEWKGYLWGRRVGTKKNPSV